MSRGIGITVGRGGGRVGSGKTNWNYVGRSARPVGSELSKKKHAELPERPARPGASLNITSTVKMKRDSDK